MKTKLEMRFEALPLGDLPKGRLVLFDSAEASEEPGLLEQKLDQVVESGILWLAVTWNSPRPPQGALLQALENLVQRLASLGGGLSLVRDLPWPEWSEEWRGFNQFFPVRSSPEEVLAHFHFLEEHPSEVAFPYRRFPCCFCGKLFRLTRPGRARCSHCGQVNKVDAAGRAE